MNQYRRTLTSIFFSWSLLANSERSPRSLLQYQTFAFPSSRNGFASTRLEVPPRSRRQVYFDSKHLLGSIRNSLERLLLLYRSVSFFSPFLPLSVCQSLELNIFTLHSKFGNNIFHLRGLEAVTDPKRSAEKGDYWKEWNPETDGPDHPAQRWLDGRTGIPFIDANMAELKSTGWALITRFALVALNETDLYTSLVPVTCRTEVVKTSLLSWQKISSTIGVSELNFSNLIFSITRWELNPSLLFATSADSFPFLVTSPLPITATGLT